MPNLIARLTQRMKEKMSTVAVTSYTPEFEQKERLERDAPWRQSTGGHSCSPSHSSPLRRKNLTAEVTHWNASKQHEPRLAALAAAFGAMATAMRSSGGKHDKIT